MGWQEDLRTRAINAGADEFHWVEAPEGTALPYAVATVVSDPRPEHLKGYTGMRVSRVQIDCFAAVELEASDLAEVLIAALSEPATVGSTKFGRGKAEGPTDLSVDAGGRTVFRKMIQLFVAHRGI